MEMRSVRSQSQPATDNAAAPATATTTPSAAATATASATTAKTPPHLELPPLLLPDPPLYPPCCHCEQMKASLR